MEDMVSNKGIVYYTCNSHPVEINELCREHLRKIKIPSVSVSLKKKINYGDKQIVVHAGRGSLMLLKQIVMGLEASEAKYVFFVESDVIYHPSHFEFTPERDDVCYFNTNVWKMRWSDGFSTRTKSAQQLSGMVANRKLLLDHYTARVKEIEEKGFDRHYEPQDIPRVNWESAVPNICIRHDSNMTKSKWSVSDYRNKKYAEGWQEGYEIPGWSKHDIFLR